MNPSKSFNPMDIKISIKVYTLMIIDCDVNFNEYDEKILNYYGLWKHHCPFCNAKNSFTRHATYKRNICIVNIDVFEEHNFTVLRLYCKSCKTTHAILPAGTIPYRFYSYACVLKILVLYYVENYSSLRISSKYNISFQMIYLFIARFLLEIYSCISFLRIYLGVSLQQYSTPSLVLSIINTKFSNMYFIKHYFIYTKHIFLMAKRRNILPSKICIGM